MDNININIDGTTTAVIKPHRPFHLMTSRDQAVWIAGGGRISSEQFAADVATICQSVGIDVANIVLMQNSISIRRVTPEQMTWLKIAMTCEENMCID